MANCFEANKLMSVSLWIVQTKCEFKSVCACICVTKLKETEKKNIRKHISLDLHRRNERKNYANTHTHTAETSIFFYTHK